jgi:hypothetical protein
MRSGGLHSLEAVDPLSDALDLGVQRTVLAACVMQALV